MVDYIQIAWQGLVSGGIMRPLNFSEENHLGNNDVIILQVKNGAWEELVVGQE